jgi:malate dehydrogenase (oxaloacetate-decarboxylating)
MIVAGVEALASLSPTLSDSKAPLLPDLGEVREVSIKIAAAVMLSAKEEGQSNNVGQWPEDREELERFIEAQMWKPRYRPLELVNTAVAQ